MKLKTTDSRSVSTGGLRNEKPLTSEQKQQVLSYAMSLGIAQEAIVFSENMNTSYKMLFGEERLYIGTDVLPNIKVGLKANSRISLKAAIAHELIGHRDAELAGKSQTADLLEEVQASIRAARFAPELSAVERIALLRDAIERLHKRGISIKEVKDKLWIDNA